MALSILSLSACGAGEPGAASLSGEPPVEPQQLDPGFKVWRQVTLTFASGVPLATVYVFNRALGGYRTGVEYWFVNRDAVSLVGRSDLTIAAVDESTTGAPTDPGYTHEQTFDLDANASWGTGWTTDPVSGGSLYDGGDANGKFIGLRLFTNAARTSIDRIVWYQDAPRGSVVVNVTPSGTFSVSAGSVAPPTGTFGFDVSQTTLN
jgi:hypothetical protein